MRTVVILTLIIGVAFSTCEDEASNSSASAVSGEGSTAQQSVELALPFLDTSIAVKAVADINSRNITLQEAEQYLYQHFSKRGVIKRSDYKADSLVYRETMCVAFDTLYNIRSSAFSGGIICYWLGVCDLNGHCFQPSKAVIVRTKNGFKISDEDFIPSSVNIDSIMRKFIYGYEYDCSARRTVRQIKIQLK